MKDHIKIDGAGIYLTSITYDDTDDIIRWRNRDFVKKRYLCRDNLTKEIHENWIKTKVETGKVIQFIIYEKCSGQKIGSVFLKDIDQQNKKCEFGIFIGEEEKLGMGYGREAAELITQYAFRELNIYKIFLKVLADNTPAYRSYVKAGFQQEGVSKAYVWIDDAPVDVIFMAIFNHK